MSENPISAADISHGLGQSQVGKAQPYLERVTDLDVHPDRVTARVQGSARPGGKDLWVPELCR